MKIIISQSAINHSLGTSVFEILEWLKQPEKIPLKQASEVVENFRTDVKVLKISRQTSLSRQEVKKMDDFTIFAIDAVKSIDLASYDKENIGIYVGTSLGGIKFGERELDKLYKKGPRKVSPYFSISMFYASNAAQISIFNDIAGSTYLFSEDILSGISALQHAYYDMKMDLREVAICGASEMPITRMGLTAITDAGMVDRENEFLTEGAGMLMLNHVKKSLPGQVEIAGIGEGYDANQGVAISLHKAFDECFSESAMNHNDVDMVFTCGNSFENQADEELEFFEKATPTARIVNLKSLMGNALSVSPIFNLIIADYIMRKGKSLLRYLKKMVRGSPCTLEVNAICSRACRR